MTANIYTELIQYEEIGGNLADRLRVINAYHIFQKTIEYYGDDHSKLNKALFYIIHTYTVGSKYHILGVDWLAIKEQIAERVGIEFGGDLYAETVLLESADVIDSIQKYIDFQGSRSFKHLVMLKELYEQMFSSSLEKIKKAGGTEVDYDQKNKNKDYATRLINEIAEWEQKVADNISTLKDGMQEIQKKKTSRDRSLRIEDHLKQ